MAQDPSPVRRGEQLSFPKPQGSQLEESATQTRHDLCAFASHALQGVVVDGFPVHIRSYASPSQVPTHGEWPQDRSP